MVLRRDARGSISEQKGTTGDNSPLARINNPAFLLQFPDRPVAVGESWSVDQNLTLGLPGPPGAGLPEMMFKLKHTLKEVQMRNGRREALIQTEGNAAISNISSPMGPQIRNATQALTGTTRFDLAGGRIAGGAFTMLYSMDMTAPAGLGAAVGAAPADGAAAPAQNIKLNGSAEITLTEEAPAPKPAPTRRPSSRRKPVRRR
ncbi:MAG: hypothetical protein FJX77_12175 [Armatimonadetes bacterium]|nr:hypothetical protein [Armatimonadota bacterium]